MKPHVLCLSLCLSASAFATSTVKPPANNKLAVAAAGNCMALANTKQPFMLVISQGQEIIKSITECAIDAKLTAASISGVGSLQNPTLEYFDPDKSSYQKHQFNGMFELTSLLGDIKLDHGKPTTHAHVTISTKQYRLRGGQLLHSNVNATSEVTFFPMANS